MQLAVTDQLNEDLLLRAGVAFDESPADKNHMSISIQIQTAFGFRLVVTMQSINIQTLI